MNLKKSAFSGIKWTACSAAVIAVLQLLQVAVLARILDPKDFGLMALAMMVIGFGQAFLDMGISNAIIYKQEIMVGQLNSLYWLNIFVGAALFAILTAFAPLVASFYEETELTGLIRLTAVAFLIQPFGQQFMALLQKDLAFDKIALVEMLNKGVMLIVSAVAAMAGYGVYSLAYGLIVSVSVSTIQYIYIGARFYKPSLVFDSGGIGEFVRFGLYQMGERTINYFNLQIDVLLIGKLAGTADLGIYNMTKQLVLQPVGMVNPILTRVSFPVMARIQDQTGKLRELYLKQVNYLSSLNFPVCAAMFVFSEDIIRIVFGPKWLSAATVLRILAVWAAARSVINPVGSLLLAKGRADWSFWWNLAMLLCVPAAIYAGSSRDLTGIAYALLLLQVSLIIPVWYLLVNRLCLAGFAEYHKQIALPAMIAAVSGLAAYTLTSMMPGGALGLAAGVAAGLAAAVLLNYRFNAGLIRDLSEIRNG